MYFCLAVNSAALSLLEVNTSSFFIPDGDGLNRFKSGFFVDNFETFQPQDTNYPVKNSIDGRNKEARPTHYTNSIDLQVGPVEGDNNIFNGADPEGTNIQKTGNIITLNGSLQTTNTLTISNGKIESINLDEIVLFIP